LGETSRCEYTTQAVPVKLEPVEHSCGSPGVTPTWWRLWLRPGRLSLPVLLVGLASLVICTQGSREAGSEKSLSRARRAWISQVKANIDPNALKASVDGLPPLVDPLRIRISKELWPEWLRNPRGGLVPPRRVSRVIDADLQHVRVIFYFGKGTGDRMIVVTDPEAPSGTDPVTISVGWIPGVTFVFGDTLMTWSQLEGLPDF
jgi:hypothetical protein